MDNRLKDLGYLTALGHTVTMQRRGITPDAIHDPESYDVDPIEVGVDIYAVRAALGERKVSDWWALYCDYDRFTSSMSAAVQALLLASLYDDGMPSGYTECLGCSGEGCDLCFGLGCAPVDMITRCPACEGDGSTARGGKCHFCHGEGMIWTDDEDDIRSSIVDEDDWRDYDAAMCRAQEAGTL